jgi:hypothetical protein
MRETSREKSNVPTLRHMIPSGVDHPLQVSNQAEDEGDPSLIVIRDGKLPTTYKSGGGRVSTGV